MEAGMLMIMLIAVAFQNNTSGSTFSSKMNASGRSTGSAKNRWAKQTRYSSNFLEPFAPKTSFSESVKAFPKDQKNHILAPHSWRERRKKSSNVSCVGHFGKTLCAQTSM